MSLSDKRKALWKTYRDKELSSHVYQIILLQDKEAIKELNQWIIKNKECQQLGFGFVKTKPLFEFIEKIFGKGLL